MSLVRKIGKIVVPSARLRGMIMNPSRLIRIPYEKYLILTIGKKQQKALNRIKKKEKIKVAFFVIHSSIWKYDDLYNLFDKNDRFEPVIIICPYIKQGNETMFKEMKLAIDLFSKKKYNIVSTYNEASGKLLDVKKEIDPDIIFFTNPYKLTKSQYYITNFLNTLTFYVSYGFMITERPIMQYDQLIHNLVFRFYLETKFHFLQAKLFSKNKGVNSLVVGYPGIDNLLHPKTHTLLNDVWKIKYKKIKRIIWAPHHTIEDNDDIFTYSNFLDYYQFMFDIAKKYQDKVQFVFKPHPILKSRLYKKPEWGIDKTDNYYEQWDNLVNGQLIESDYIDLFLTSDAMIHDSGSFITEYMVTNKPALYQLRNDSILKGFNDLGKRIVNCQYLARCYEDVINFIENTVINENDPLKIKRELLINEYFLINDKQTASENIYFDICDILR